MSLGIKNASIARDAQIKHSKIKVLTGTSNPTTVGEDARVPRDGDELIRTDTGAFMKYINGAWATVNTSALTSIAATLTVDELILDTDGVAPAATNCYLVRDNEGDLTLNAITGKTINLAINSVDEYAFGATALDCNGNHLDNAGYLILNAVTLPASTEVYIGHDNAGDCSINALTGKAVHMAVAGTDVADFAGTAITFRQAVTITTGGIAATGNSTITGDLAVTGALSFGGALNLGATLTVDELILDTDGVAPAGTNAYVVSDNTGDLTLNALTGKTINLAINNTDEYVFGASALDCLGNHLDNAGYLIMNATTLPAGTEVYAGHDNTGDLTLNALTGKDINFAINGTDEVRIKADELELVSATNIQFLGDDDIVDSNANELITFSATAAAVNGFQVKNAATGARPAFGSNGASAEADIGLNLLDSNGNELVELVAVATATNGLLITNAATGDPVMIGANGTGATANRGIRFNDSNGNEELVLVSTASAVNEIGIVNSATGVKPIIRSQGEADTGITFANYDGTNTEEILILAQTATAVNEITITNAAIGGNVQVAATGNDAAIHLLLKGKGTAGVNLGQVNNNYLYGATAAHTADTADGCLYLQSTSHVTKGFVCLANADLGLVIGSDGSVDRATTVGTNAIHIFNGTAPVGTLANGISIHSSGGECYILDAAGNSTLQSPHSKDGDYIIHSYSADKKQTVRIHIEKMLKALIDEDPSKYGKFLEVFDGCRQNKGDLEN